MLCRTLTFTISGLILFYSYFLMRIWLSSFTSSTSLTGACILESAFGLDTRHIVLNHQDALHVHSIVDTEYGMELVPTCSISMEQGGTLRVAAVMAVPHSLASHLFVSVMSDRSIRLYQLAVGNGGTGHQALQLASSTLGEEKSLASNRMCHPHNTL